MLLKPHAAQDPPTPSLEQLRDPMPCLHPLLTHTPQPCIELVPKAAWCSM